MSTECMFDIMELPQEKLKMVLPKASSRALIRLLAAYPRSAGRIFMSLLSESLSPATMEFLREELNHAQLPSLPQIREAETELIRLIEALKDTPIDAAP